MNGWSFCELRREAEAENREEIAQGSWCLWLLAWSHGSALFSTFWAGAASRATFVPSWYQESKAKSSAAFPLGVGGRNPVQAQGLHGNLVEVAGASIRGSETRVRCGLCVGSVTLGSYFTSLSPFLDS